MSKYDKDNKMIFKQIESGGDRNYSYLVADERTGEGAIIDPAPDTAAVLRIIRKLEIVLRYVINTHSHYDHSQGNDAFHRQGKGYPVTFINCGRDTDVKDGEIIDISGIILEIITTPGHTDDSICIKVSEKKVDDPKNRPVDKLITGDTLFIGKVGGTYNKEDSRKEFESLRKLMSLSPDTEIWPGHDYGTKPVSTIEYELKNNPFIRRLSDFDDFLWLKQNWTQYKKDHGIK